MKFLNAVSCKKYLFSLTAKYFGDMIKKVKKQMVEQKKGDKGKEEE